MNHIRGKFDVQVMSQAPVEGLGDPAIQRVVVEKRFHGALDAVSKGEMLGRRTPSMDTGGYVAMERVVGTLDGRKGSFTLQHSGTMQPGSMKFAIGVVPGSGSDGLAGLTGTMDIEIAGGEHFYAFDYSLGTA